jgi:hypothetical protein
MSVFCSPRWRFNDDDDDDDGKDDDDDDDDDDNIDISSDDAHVRPISITFLPFLGSLSKSSSLLVLLCLDCT